MSLELGDVSGGPADRVMLLISKIGRLKEAGKVPFALPDAELDDIAARLLRYEAGEEGVVVQADADYLSVLYSRIVESDVWSEANKARMRAEVEAMGVKVDKDEPEEGAR
jgi:hypothetical protein